MTEAAEPKPEERIAPSAETLRRLLPMAGKTLSNLPLAFVLLMLYSGVRVLLPQVLRFAVDGPMTAPELLGRSAAYSQLKELTWLFLGLLAVGFTIEYLSALLLQRFGQTLVLNLRSRLYAKMHRLPITFFDKHAVGRTVSRIVNDSEALSELFTSVLAAGIGDTILLLAILVVLLITDPILSAILFLCCPFLIALVLWFRKHSAPLYQTQRQVLARLNAFMSESLNGLATVKSFNGETFLRRRFEELNSLYLNNELQLITMVARFRPGFAVARIAATGLLLTAGGYSVLYGHSSIGTLISSLLYVRLLFTPLEQLAERYNILIRANVASQRVLSLLDHDEERRTGNEELGACEIAFRNVTYFYDQDKPVLKDVSFTLKPGQSLALVGPTGSGKSTIVSLILGYYRLDEEKGHQGSILIDGVPLDEINLEQWRRRLAFVSQDLFLFRASIERNVSLFSEISPDRLEQAMKNSGVATFLQQLPQGAQTEVGEQGQALSSGQRQLLSFARALAFDPQLLVLDEATANIDSETEAQLESVLDYMLEGRQALIVAHRLSTVRRADQILVLEEGRIVESGPHDALIKKGGLYARMAKEADLLSDGHV